MSRTLRRPDDHNGHISSAEIVEDLNRTQQRIDSTLNLITSKMNPKSIGSELGAYLVDTIHHFELEDLRHFASRTADRTGQFIKEHPVPVFFGCLAVASCLLGRNGRSHPHEEEEESHGRLRTAAGNAAATASATATRVSAAAAREAKALASTARSTRHAVSERAGEGVEKLDELAHRTSDRIAGAAHRTADVARESSARLRSAATDTAETHPLGMALGALAVGFLTALVLPGPGREKGDS
ncbi:MAG: hypothetical protein GXX91_03175 [Verrucomicrobiaceae bacterium]|nr:hypothetical protein [Verrucomicrobiaceae bacterium]